MQTRRGRPEDPKAAVLESLGRTPKVALSLVVLGLLLAPLVPVALFVEWVALVLGFVSWPHRLGKIACAGAVLASLAILVVLVLLIPAPQPSGR